MQAKKKKKRIRRGTGAHYFSLETQAAIKEFQTSDDNTFKEKTYKEKIYPAFDKLAENLIFVYGFINPGDQYLTLKADCVSFLFETLYKWDDSRGTKAFSYFNVVAKNWLIAHARKVKKKLRRNISIDNASGLSPDDKRCIAMFDFVPAPDEFIIKRETINEIYDVLDEIEGRVRSEKEIACIKAIKIVFESVDELDFLNKRAVFVYVRDISGLNPKQLSVAMSAIRRHYRDIINKRRVFT